MTNKDIITTEEYLKLNKKEQLHYYPHEWSEYEDRKEEKENYTCFKCGNLVTEIIKVPTSTARIISYKRAFISKWVEEVNRLIKYNNLTKND